MACWRREGEEDFDSLEAAAVFECALTEGGWKERRKKERSREGGRGLRFVYTSPSSYSSPPPPPLFFPVPKNLSDERSPPPPPLLAREKKTKMGRRWVRNLFFSFFGFARPLSTSVFLFLFSKGHLANRDLLFLFYFFFPTKGNRPIFF